MDDFIGFLGALICAAPIGIDQCFSAAGKASLGTWAAVALIGMGSFHFLMRNPRR